MNIITIYERTIQKNQINERNIYRRFNNDVVCNIKKYTK